MATQYIWQAQNWPHFSYHMEVLQPQLEAVQKQQAHLLGQLQALPTGEDRQAQMDALIQNAIRTSEIEGEQLNVGSVRSSVAKQLGLNQAGLPPTTPQTDALVAMLLDATEHYSQPLSFERLCGWQAALFPHHETTLTPVIVGALRDDDPMQVVSGRVDKPHVHFEAPPRTDLEQELAAFITWFNQPPGGLDPILRAGIAHLWLITLHSFDDGNGRVTRAVTDMALAQAEQQSIRFYSLSAAIMARRKEYYVQLEQAQKGELDITNWLAWYLSVLEDALLQGQARFQRVLAKARYWQHHAQTILSERQVKVLNRLLDAGVGTQTATEFEMGIAAKHYISLAKVSKATATRELSDLLEKGCLNKLPGGGRSTRYIISWD